MLFFRIQILINDFLKAPFNKRNKKYKIFDFGKTKNGKTKNRIC